MKYVGLIKLVNKFATLAQIDDINLHKLYKLISEAYEGEAPGGVFAAGYEDIFENIVKSLYPDTSNYMDVFKKNASYFMDKELKKSNPNIMFLVDFFLLSDRAGQLRYIRLMPNKALPSIFEVSPYYDWHSDVLLYFYKRLGDYYRSIGKTMYALNVHRLMKPVMKKYTNEMEDEMEIEEEEENLGLGWKRMKQYKDPHSFKNFKEKNIYSDDDIDIFETLHEWDLLHKPVEITDLHEFLNPPKQQAIRQSDGKLVEIDEKGELVEVEEKKPDLKLVT